MNEHEIDRIAAAANQLRPDWPVASVRTLLRKPELANRPRRDVAVALAWIACEANTATPARILEAGPWWRAAGIEGQASRREVLNPAERCGICSEREDRCRGLWGTDHDFEPDFKRPPEVDVTATVAALKAEVAPTPVIAQPKPLDELLPTERNEHAEAARQAIKPNEEDAA